MSGLKLTDQLGDQGDPGRDATPPLPRPSTAPLLGSRRHRWGATAGLQWRTSPFRGFREAIAAPRQQWGAFLVTYERDASLPHRRRAGTPPRRSDGFCCRASTAWYGRNADASRG